MIPKRSLGDGVYAAVERGMVKVTTEDGIRETNTIYLEPEVQQRVLSLMHLKAKRSLKR